MVPACILNRESPTGRAVSLALFLLPIVYLADMVSVAVHEILGHGLSAVLVGGTFSGLMVKWDGMGVALCDLPVAAPLAHCILFLASGVMAEMVFGVLLLGFAMLLRGRPDIQLVPLIVAFICVIDGASYVLWNAYRPVPPGDIGSIVLLLSAEQLPEVSTVRWALLAAGALLFLGATFYFCVSVFVRVEALILCDKQFVGPSRLLALFVFLVLPGSVAWFIFDWDQLAPGIGRLPSIIGALSILAVATLLFWHRPTLKRECSLRPVTWRHIAGSWICLIATVIVITRWFKDGVMWG